MRLGSLIVAETYSTETTYWHQLLLDACSFVLLFHPNEENKNQQESLKKPTMSFFSSSYIPIHLKSLEKNQQQKSACGMNKFFLS